MDIIATDPIMPSIVAWLLPYSQFITIISTIAIAISAVITVSLTWRLTRDNRNLAKAGAEPEVVAYLGSDPFQPYTNFVIANVGRGPAKNVEFEFDLEESHYNRIVLKNEPDRKPHGFLLQGERREIPFGDRRLFGDGEDREKNALRPFQVAVKWKNLRGKEFDATYILDVRQFLGIPPTSSLFDPLSKIANSLTKIEKSLAR